MGHEAFLNTYLHTCRELLTRIEPGPIERACDALHKVYTQGNTLFACGNGGSAANASHFIEDVAKLMWQETSQKRLRSVALTDATPFITALANDDGYERIFDIQLATQANPQDALVCISGSGNSKNVLRAARWANAHDMTTIGLTGYDGGALASLCHIHVHVPSDNMGMLECVHMMLLDYISKAMRYRAYGVLHAER